MCLPQMIEEILMPFAAAFNQPQVEAASAVIVVCGKLGARQDAAAIYAEDMYVPCSFSEETAKRIPGIATWVTPEYEHNGLRADGEKLLDVLAKELSHQASHDALTGLANRREFERRLTASLNSVRHDGEAHLLGGRAA